MMPDLYHTLRALHEVMDQPRQALNFYMIAAHMSRKVSKHSSRCTALFVCDSCA
jgi:hypothetical protein